MSRLKYETGLFYREPCADRPMLSANDWWGYGFITGMCGQQPRADQYVRWYCGQKGAYEQFRRGQREGRRQREANASHVDAE